MKRQPVVVPLFSLQCMMCNVVETMIIVFLFLSDEGPMLETLDHTIRIGSTPTFLYFDLQHDNTLMV